MNILREWGYADGDAPRAARARGAVRSRLPPDRATERPGGWLQTGMEFFSAGRWRAGRWSMLVGHSVTGPALRPLEQPKPKGNPPACDAGGIRASPNLRQGKNAGAVFLQRFRVLPAG